MTWLLTLNAGSSSLKFALYEASAAKPEVRAIGQIEGLGAASHLVMRDAAGDKVEDCRFSDNEASCHESALAIILTTLQRHAPSAGIAAVGHRVVHGGPLYAAPLVLDDEILANLSDYSALAPLHQPHNLEGIAIARKAFPGAVQVACFDTAFHRSHPWVADTFALPRHLYDKGVRRYGFHGLSYEYVTRYLREKAPHEAAGRLVVAHLGSGASMCAINNGQSVGSTMGFSALDGLPMGTRPGQLDPGVLLYLMDHENMPAKEISDLLYKESGLKGLSGLSADMRVLESAGTPEAQQAISYFVSRVRREIGAMAAILDGIDALAFCGGIGENASRVREKICANMSWLGLELDSERNAAGAFVLSAPESRVKVFLVKTDEEAMIAHHTWSLLRSHRPQRELASHLAAAN